MNATEARRRAQSLVDRLYEAATRYGQVQRLPLERGDLGHDLALMLADDDLTDARLELLGPGNTLVWAFWPDARPEAWPVLAPGVVSAGRLVVDRRGRDAAYRDRLRLQWGGCTRAHADAADDLGGNDGRFRVGSANRVVVVVQRAGPRFAFGSCAELGLHNIFLLPAHAPRGWRFAPGQRIHCTLVSTRDGIQARAIRPEAEPSPTTS